MTIWGIKAVAWLPKKLLLIFNFTHFELYTPVRYPTSTHSRQNAVPPVTLSIFPRSNDQWFLLLPLTNGPLPLHSSLRKYPNILPSRWHHQSQRQSATNNAYQQKSQESIPLFSLRTTKVDGAQNVTIATLVKSFVNWSRFRSYETKVTRVSSDKIVWSEQGSASATVTEPWWVDSHVYIRLMVPPLDSQLSSTSATKSTICGSPYKPGSTRPPNLYRIRRMEIQEGWNLVILTRQADGEVAKRGLFGCKRSVLIAARVPSNPATILC